MNTRGAAEAAPPRGTPLGLSRATLAAMTRRVFLPLAAPPEPLPQLDAVRSKLGGRVGGQVVSGVGEPVDVDHAGSSQPGVVLFSDGEHADVYLGRGRVQRTRREKLGPHAGELPSELRQVALEIRVFAGLREGERVRYVDREQGLSEALLVEKCRFGAVVLRADERLMGVGFRNLWPLESGVS